MTALTASKPRGIPSPIIAIVLVLMAETMLFAGLIGACVLMRSRAPGAWPPADLPRLPWGVTLANTLALLATVPMLSSGVARVSSPLVLASAGLGFLFLIVQGFEWTRMLAWRAADPAYTGMFDALIGTHALHVLAGAIALTWVALTMRRLEDPTMRLKVTTTYWYFVVAVWPILYALVYR